MQIHDISFWGQAPACQKHPKQNHRKGYSHRCGSESPAWPDPRNSGHQATCDKSSPKAPADRGADN